MNKIILMGRLTRDPEVRYLQDGKCCAKFSLAVDRRYKTENGASADFFNVSAWGKLGEFTEKYLKKGTKIVLTGRVENDNYTNGHGEKVYSFTVVAEEMEFAESKNNSGSGAGETAGERWQDSTDGFMNIPNGVDDELPFA